MSRIFYVNGDFVPQEQAKISVLDRGFLFADAVYEVTTVLAGQLIDNEAHLRRLHRSLSELSMPSPISDTDLVKMQQKLVALNELQEGVLYLQISRGIADRDFAYPEVAEPSLVMFTQKKSIIDSAQAEAGISVISLPDQRWKRRDIKTVGLLGPSMAKQAALDAGAQDAWMVEDGLVTEGTSNNAYIIKDDGVIQTRQLGPEILSGVTRAALIRLSELENMTILEQPFSIADAMNANEAFISSASTFVMPVVSIDGQAIGDGKPGPITRRLRKLYIDIALERQAFDSV